MITQKAYAKINLFLNVTGKKPDGFHTLEMINARIDLADTITMSQIDLPNTAIIRSNDLFLSSQDNIVHDLAVYLINTYRPNHGIRIDIDKQIPFGAGLGGNSADCATLIHSLDDLFALRLTDEEKTGIALRFGADIPYCLTNLPALVEGVGEKVTPIAINLSDYEVLLVHPRIFIATKDIFALGDKQGFQNTDIHLALTRLKDDDIPGFMDLLHNSLQGIALKKYPELETLHELLKSNLGAKGLVMTGSGSTFIKLLRRGEKVNSGFIAKLREKYFVERFSFK